MATVFDLGLLSEFSEVFLWILIFVVVYGILQMTDIFKNRGLHALAAISVTIVLGITGSTTTVIEGLAPWFVITGFFIIFLLVLAQFIGVDIHDTVFGGSSGIWWIFVPLIIGLVISLVAGGQFARETTTIDPETGETITTPGNAVINIITEPKILGFILILAISSVTVALMAGVPKLSS
ncbi:hypothetical protein CMO88_00640 [Candidatus Woesearchaeota archaeon]|nr:hypothetical protein [Candidatus Woesearchaeota archaeon]|tara:strand:- start:9511 stop:10050 length:540 start_codon:yes stop_codon:yes gene_type:complete